jgi:hypothetical protein
VETLGNQRLTFIVGMCLLILGLGISRILFFIFDFHLTQYDSELVYVFPYVLAWRFGSFLATALGVPILYVVERDIYEFKTKKIPTVFLSILSVIPLVYPINNKFDFDVVSAISASATLVSLLVPIGFIYLARRTSGQMRKVCIMISLTIFLYGIAAILITDFVGNAMEAAIPGSRTAIIIIVPVLKIFSLITMTYASVNFRI